MQTSLSGRKVAILVTNGFEESELSEPRAALQAAGAVVQVVSPEPREVRAWKFENWGERFPVDVALATAQADDYDALVLPGGLLSPDRLRMDEEAVGFVRHFVEEGKPIAAICHGPWTLIEAGGAEGRMMTSYRSLQSDLRNAGAHWVDEPVVVDRGVVTSRNPGDLKIFNKKMLEVFAARARRCE